MSVSVARRAMGHRPRWGWCVRSLLPALLPALLLIPLLLAGQRSFAKADGRVRSAPARGAAGRTEDPTLGALVARTFLQSLSDGDVKAALPLCADGLDFDGTLAKDRAAVKAALQKMTARMGGHRRVRYVTVLSLAEARRRFGPPPARLGLPSGGSVLVGFARYRRGGLVAFVAEVQGRYRVVALTD